jgi:hypothetical protein
MVIQQRGTLVETTGMPGIPKPESFKIQVMTKFVAQGAQEGPEEVTSLRTAVLIYTRISFVPG